MSSEWFKMDNLFVYPTLFFSVVELGEKCVCSYMVFSCLFFNPVH